MKFFDIVKLTIHSGNGGNGIVAARRESKVPYGGPSGGNGGRGGDLWFVGSKHENTLQQYLYHHDYKAEDGNHGEGKEKYGADGKDLRLVVPLGTVIKDQETGHILHQITADGEERLAARGGAGGTGNMHFKTSILQYPEFATLGEPGVHRDLVLELQLLGDVALIGTPSVGKSTLINASSNAKAKVAEYHFTTLVPNLGMVNQGGHHFTMIDIPGLIEHAHEGKGLGNAFLRHILKANVFCFVHDLSLYERGVKDALTLMNEIKAYISQHFVGSTDFDDPVVDVSYRIEIINKQIHRKTFLHFDDQEPQLFMDKMLVFVLSKYDLINDEEILALYQEQLIEFLVAYFAEEFSVSLASDVLRHNMFSLSAATRFGLDAFLSRISHAMKDYDFTNQVTLELAERHRRTPPLITDITEESLEYLLEQDYLDLTDTKFLRVWEIHAPLIVKAAFMTMWGNDQGEQWFWRKIESVGFLNEADQAGIRYGDVIKFPAGHYRGQEDKWVKWML